MTKKRSKLPMPFPRMFGYAKLVKSAKKAHQCVECRDTIHLGDTYVCVHESTEDGWFWNSLPLCCDCYNKLRPDACISHDIDESNTCAHTDVNSNQDYSERSNDSATSRIKQVYQTSDGELFDDSSKALAHEVILAGSAKLVLYSANSRVYNVEDALFAYIPDYEAMYAFDDYCKRSVIYAERDLPARNSSEYGLYVWDPSDVQFKYMPNPAVNALKSFIQYMLNLNANTIR